MTSFVMQEMKTLIVDLGAWPNNMLDEVLLINKCEIFKNKIT